jgi:hypothetical protein
LAFTYRPGSRTTLNRIRVRIADTDQFASPDLRLEDEEISDFVLTEGGFMRAAAAAAEALAAKFARKAEGNQGPDRIVPSDRANHLRRIAAQLRSAASAACLPTAGGISIAVKDANTTNPDRATPAFRRGLLDHPDGA